MDIQKDMEEALLYLDEDQRLNTFKSWVFSNKVPCNVKTMAEAGFVHVGSKHDPDTVKCFFCSKTLDGWEETDNPWKEHLKHAPYCSFAKLQRSQYDLTVKEVIELRHDLLTRIVDKHIEEKVLIVSNLFKKLESALKKL